MNRTPAVASLLFALAVAPLSAQELRRALVDADLVAVGRQVGKTAFSPDVDLHRIQITAALRGVPDGQTTATVIDWPHLSLHVRPSPRQSRLYCLQEAAREAQRLGLPVADGPYYRMSNAAGSNPLVGADLTTDPTFRFAQILAAADRGVTPAATAAAIVDTALGDDAAMRLEATRHLAEQPLLRQRLLPVQWSRLLGRTSAETADVDYKIALAELCAEQRLDGVVDALIVGLGSVPDPAYSAAVGRLCASLLGEDAAAPLLQRLQTTGDDATRKAIILAVGATRTPRALDALLQLQQAGTAEQAVTEALKMHGCRQALEAAAKKSDAGKTGK